jgi:hypothetical protein
LSDEWYLTVGKDVPKNHHYDGLELEENGVGQVRSFKELWNNFDEPKIEKEKKVTIGSGTLISETFQNWFPTDGCFEYSYWFRRECVCCKLG